MRTVYDGNSERGRRDAGEEGKRGYGGRGWGGMRTVYDGNSES